MLLFRPHLQLLRPHTVRSFHALRPAFLIFNSGKSEPKPKPTVQSPPSVENPIKKAPATKAPTTPITPHTKPATAQAPSKTNFQDKVDLAKSKVLTNKYYLMTPNFLKPYVAGFLTRPIGFGVSFFILHELTAIIPLLTLWWLFIKFQWIPVDLPTEFILKGTEILTSRLMDIPDSKLIYDKASIILAGANAYAATKLLMPVRLPLSILLTPWFDRVIVQRVRSLFRKKKA